MAHYFARFSQVRVSDVPPTGVLLAPGRSVADMSTLANALRGHASQFGRSCAMAIRTARKLRRPVNSGTRAHRIVSGHYAPLIWA